MSTIVPETTEPETTISEADRYLKEVTPFLAAVPAEERADLLDDLAQHLREIAAEPGPPLAERLGSPEAYAAELLASAGVAAAGLGDAVSRRRALRVRLAPLAARARASRVGGEVLRLRPVLLPAWWVFRAYLAVSLLAAVERRGHNPGFPLPRLAGNPVVGLVAIVLAIPLSVRIGQRSLPRAGRLAETGANVGLAVFALTLLGSASTSHVSYIQVSDGPQSTGGQACLTTASGQNITNLYAYSADGTLLDPVLLYDQDGHPIDNLCPDFDDQGRPLTNQYGKDVNGAPVINAFPRHQSVVLQPGSSTDPALPPQPASTVPVNPPAVVVPRLAPTTTTTTTTPPSAAAASTTTTSATTVPPAG